MSSHADCLAVMQPSDGMPQRREKDIDSKCNSLAENQQSSKMDQSAQICFGSWSDAFDECEVVMPPPKILVGRGLRSRPHAKSEKSQSAVSNGARVSCDNSVDAAGTANESRSHPSTRAWHNRRVGSSLLESEGKDRVQWTSIARSAEFEAFLQDL
jgi:hypothetical protein